MFCKCSIIHFLSQYSYTGNKHVKGVLSHSIWLLRLIYKLSYLYTNPLYRGGTMSVIILCQESGSIHSFLSLFVGFIAVKTGMSRRGRCRLVGEAAQFFTMTIKTNKYILLYDLISEM